MARRKPESIAADASYGNGEFAQLLTDREITPYMPTRDAVGRTRSLLYGPESFTLLPRGEQQLHLPCRPAAELQRTQRGESHLRLHRNPQEVRPVRTEIPVHDRTVPVSCNPHERSSSGSERGRPPQTTPEFGQAQRQAKEGQALFAEPRVTVTSASIGSHIRRLKFVRERVLPRGHCPEHQTASPVPQPTNDVTGSR